MNDETIIGQFTHEGTTYNVIKTHYDTQEGPVALIAQPLESNDFSDNTVLTVNLEGYGILPYPGYVNIDHKVVGTPLYRAFADAFSDPEKPTYPVKYGFVESYALPIKNL